MERPEIEQQKIILANYLETEPEKINFDWNCFHGCYNKMCSTSTGKNAIDLEMFDRTDRIGAAISASNLVDSFEMLIEAITFYESFFKTPRKRKTDAESKNDNVNS